MDKEEEERGGGIIAEFICLSAGAESIQWQRAKQGNQHVYNAETPTRDLSRDSPLTRLSMWHPGTVEHIPMDGAGAEGEDQKIPADHGEAFARVIRHAQTKVLGLTGVRDAVPKGRVEGPESA